MVTHDQGLSQRMSRTLRLVDGQIEDLSGEELEDM